MGSSQAASGPDFSKGIAVGDIDEGGTIFGRVGDEPVLLSRLKGRLHAVGGACTHYGAALADGRTDGETVRCPWHHACFSRITGAALGAPALDPLDRWKVEVEGETAFVREKLPRLKSPFRPTPVDRVVIVGGGAAGLACANELRALGYNGEIIILSADRDPPVDRPNLSKDYLAGTAPEEWMPLRPDDWYRDQKIDLRLGTEVVRVDPAAGFVRTAGGGDIAFDRLLLATGSDPNRLPVRGFDLDNVFTLRSFTDARAIVAAAGEAGRVAIIGSSFIGLEAAAALRARKIEVDVVSPESVPFERVLGAELGRFLQTLHEDHGVRFHLGTTASDFDGKVLRLANGRSIEADFLLVGVGVRPRTKIAEAAGLDVSDGVRVDQFLESSARGIYAAGDIAAYPDPLSGERIRIEHWVTAERQGQAVAANMLGSAAPFTAVPFFWTEQYGVAVRYVGRASASDTITIDGELGRRDFIARYFKGGAHVASASVNRDKDCLDDELRFETAIAAATNGARCGNLAPTPASKVAG